MSIKLTLLLFFNIISVYVSRLNIGLALVAMTNGEGANPNYPLYNWTEQQRSYILSSFYWGYILTQFLGGYLSRLYGTKIVMLSATFSSSLFTVLIPFCVPWGGWQVFCALRTLQGLSQGMLFPCIHGHLAKWAPVHERTRHSVFSHMGIQWGAILATSTSGIIAAGPMGWPGLSYVAAGIGFFWCLAWLLLAANNPIESRLISMKEKIFIESSLAHTDDFHKQKIPIPWRSILTSVPFIAFIVVYCAIEWGLATKFTQQPAWLNGVFKMDIKSNALYSSIPHMVTWIMSCIYVIIADVVMKKTLVSLTVLRKTFNTFATWIPAGIFIALGFLNENQVTLAVVLNSLFGVFSCGIYIGCAFNTIDLSPNHAAVLIGIANGLSNIMPIISPLIVGVVVSDVQDQSQWQIIFITSGVIFFVGNLVFLIFGTTEVQPWNEPNFSNRQIGRVDEESFANTERKEFEDNVSITKTY